MAEISDAPIKKEAFMHHAGCRYLSPRPSISQRWMGDLFLKSFNVMLKMSRRPESHVESLLDLNRWLCGVQARYKKSGDFLWPYLVGGRGVPVVLLHGFGADKDRFGSLVPFLRRTFQVIVPDIPGFGDHAPDWSLCYDIQRQVDRLQVFFRDQEIFGLNPVVR